MAKNSKKIKEAAANGIAPVRPAEEIPSAPKPEISQTSVRSKNSRAGTAARAKSGGKRAGVSRPKAAPTEKPKKAASRKRPARAEVNFSDEEIRLRAYLISEWRMQNGVAGDSTGDWVEARRQLQEEASLRA